MKNLRFALAGAALAGVLAATALAQTPPAAQAPATAPAASPQALTIKMAAQNNSGENGTAVLTQVPAGVQVVVHLSGAPQGVAQPTHIHVGNCGKINAAPEYPLSNTVDGAGTSVVPKVQLADLLKGTYAINVHKSANDIPTYVSCGNIKASAAAPAASPMK